MGGFFSALGSGIAGAGQAAGEYGHQVRGQLEARRKDFADLLGTAAQTETDPQTRNALLKHQADLHSGKPIGKIAQDFQATLQKRQADEQALHSVIRQPPQPPAPKPGPAPLGTVPGITPASAPAQPPVAPIRPLGFDEESAFNQPEPVAPIAAQPATNPIAGPQGGIKLPGPGIAPITPSAMSAVNAPILPSQPVAEDPRARREAILNDYGNRYRNATPAMRPIIKSQMDDAIAALAPFELTAQRKAAFEEFSNTPGFKALPEYAQQAYRAQAFGLSPVNMPQGALVPTKYQSHSDTLTPELRAQFGIPADYTGPVTISKNRIDNSITDVIPGNPGVAVITNPDGTQSFALKAPGSAGVTASQVAPRQTGVDAQGHPTFESVIGMKTGAAPLVGAGVNPTFIPTHATTVSQIPGQLPTVNTSTHTKGAGGGVLPGPGAAPASVVRTPAPAGKVSGAPGSITPQASGGGGSGSLEDQIVKQKYDEWTSGVSIPTGREKTAVDAYIAKNKLPTPPPPMSPAGENAVAQLDPILEEVKRTKAQLQEAIKKGYSKADLARDYAAYKYLRINSPQTSLISNLGFTGLRSALNAMKGSGSRAYPVIEKALEHTPVLSLNPSSPAQALVMLEEMEKRLITGRESIVKNSPKSGIIPMQATSPAIQPVPGDAVSDLINEYKSKK